MATKYRAASMPFNFWEGAGQLFRRYEILFGNDAKKLTEAAPRRHDCTARHNAIATDKFQSEFFGHNP